jgi:hypothetical protein
MTKKELNTKYKTKNKKSIGSHKENGENKKDDPEKGVELKERSVKKSQFYSQPFYKKIYFLWTSPYTKFWINFLSYIGFLILFGIGKLYSLYSKNPFILISFKHKIKSYTLASMWKFIPR